MNAAWEITSGFPPVFAPVTIAILLVKSALKGSIFTSPKIFARENIGMVSEEQSKAQSENPRKASSVIIATSGQAQNFRPGPKLTTLPRTAGTLCGRTLQHITAATAV
jgi:hypothetical protein